MYHSVKFTNKKPKIVLPKLYNILILVSQGWRCFLIWYIIWHVSVKCKIGSKSKNAKATTQKGNNILWLSNFKLTGLSLDRRYIQNEYLNKIQSAELTGYEQTADFQTTKGTADLKSTK